MLSCLWGGAYKRTLAVNRRVDHVAAAGFFSHYLSGTLPYVRRHITVNKMQWRRKMPKSGGAHRHVIYLPSVKNQYKRAVFGYMVIN